MQKGVWKWRFRLTCNKSFGSLSCGLIFNLTRLEYLDTLISLKENPQFR